MPTASRSKPAIRFFRAGWRAFLPVLKDAPIILLDEASASLDVENETVIQEALSRLIPAIFFGRREPTRFRAATGFSVADQHVPEHPEQIVSRPAEARG